jgi:hypothetical protein
MSLNMILGTKIADQNLDVVGTPREALYCTAGDLNNLSRYHYKYY